MYGGVYEDPGRAPRREVLGHRRPGTGRRTTPSKMAFSTMPDGPLSQAMQGSARREMFERRAGTGRTTTPRRFDSIHESAMKNPNGRLARMGGGMAERSFGGDLTNGSYRAQPYAGLTGGYSKQPMYQQQVVYQPQPQPQVVYQPQAQPQMVVYQPQPQMVYQPQPQPVSFVQEPSQYREEASHYAHEPSYTAARQQPARTIRSKPGTGREAPRGRFNFQISDSSREEARRNLARKQAAARAAEMQAQQSMRVVQQPISVAPRANQMAYHDTSADYSDEEDLGMTVRPPPPGTIDMMAGGYDDVRRSRRHRSRRHYRDNKEDRHQPAGRTAPYEQHYPPAEREPSYPSPPSVDESSVVSSEAETEQETTIDPDEAAERQRAEEEEAKAWEKNPADEIAELEQQHQEEEAVEQQSFDQEPDMGGMDDIGGGTEYYDDEDEVEIVQPVERAAKKKEKQKAKKKAPKRKDANYQYVPVEQPQAYVITPPAEPEEGDHTPGCRRSRRRKMSPLAWWKGESVLYNRRMSAACIEVKAIRKCPDALTPYKRRRVDDDAPLAICDRTVDSSVASSVADTDNGSP